MKKLWSRWDWKNILFLQLYPLIFTSWGPHNFHTVLPSHPVISVFWVYMFTLLYKWQFRFNILSHTGYGHFLLFNKWYFEQEITFLSFKFEGYKNSLFSLQENSPFLPPSLPPSLPSFLLSSFPSFLPPLLPTLLLQHLVILFLVVLLLLLLLLSLSVSLSLLYMKRYKSSVQILLFVSRNESLNHNIMFLMSTISSVHILF